MQKGTRTGRALATARKHLASVPEAERHATRRRPQRPPLGQILLDQGAIEPGNLLKAVAMRARVDARLGDILLAHGWVRPEDLMTALATQWRAAVVDLVKRPPDPRLIDRIGAEFCLREALVPWQRIGGETAIATARPEHFAQIEDRLSAAFGPCRMVLAQEAAVHAALLARRQTALIRRAEASVPASRSCRSQSLPARLRNDIRIVAGIALLIALGTIPVGVFAAILFWTITTLIATMTLKSCAACAEIRAQGRRSAVDRLRALPEGISATPPAIPIRLPMISILVPLFREADIAAQLIDRLSRLNYPPELLDIILVVEEIDTATRSALVEARLPIWMRIVTVPDGPVRTKPRAMNFALHFCRGSIIGVYDAEDRPDPEQLHIVAKSFAAAAPDVACLQGVLDFYNPRSNWLARCFTIEYAVWFRVFLPGLARLGLVVPLGGTTLFFRRKVLKDLGGWDAWNVTEDADLGLRLARHGFRTELVPTVTTEEANCRLLPWVKQRSRWLKGFAMTWAVHMRDPLGLWRDLGTKRFLAVQALLIASFSQYLLAPVLWGFWMLVLHLPHPAQSVLPGGTIIAPVALFVLSELINIAIAAWALRGVTHRWLIPWVPTMHCYFPLGTFACWRAAYETLRRPFFWDKTSHGHFKAQQVQPLAQPPDTPGA